MKVFCDTSVLVAASLENHPNARLVLRKQSRFIQMRDTPEASEKNDLSLRVLRLSGFGQSLQVADAAPNRKVQLPREDHRGKRFALTLAPYRFGDQILILTEKNPAEFTGAAE